MKKFFATVLIVFVCFSVFCVENGKHRIIFEGSPYSYQNFDMEGKSDNLKSKYGFGFKCGYTLKPFKYSGFITGADVSWVKYDVKNVEKDFNDVMLLAKAGWDFRATYALNIAPIVYMGLDIQRFNDKNGFVFTMGPAVNFTYRITRKWSIEAVAEGLFAFSKADNIDYKNIKFNTFVGVSYWL